MSDKECIPDGRADGIVAVERTLTLRVSQYDSFGPGSVRGYRFHVDKDGRWRLKVVSANSDTWGEWLPFPDPSTDTASSRLAIPVLQSWMWILSLSDIREVFVSYAEYSRHERYASHPACYTVTYEEGGEVRLFWEEPCGGFDGDLPEGILRDLLDTIERAASGGQPAAVPDEYLEDPGCIRYVPSGSGAGDAVADSARKIWLQYHREHWHDWWKFDGMMLMALWAAIEQANVAWEEGLTAQEAAEVRQAIRWFKRV